MFYVSRERISKDVKQYIYELISEQSPAIITRQKLYIRFIYFISIVPFSETWKC